jgi:hypothetical protein
MIFQALKMAHTQLMSLHNVPYEKSINHQILEHVSTHYLALDY